ncbi:MAG: hypothetical protein OEY89_14335 [Gammaproteobacteria bacterium]|nr:hypothetical protein [Gammaproteobacteria bacterium]
MKKSRYNNARLFSSEDGKPAIFPGIRPREIGAAKGVIFHEVKELDRLEKLANYYYNDPYLWWRIVDANPEYLCAYDMVVDKKHVYPPVTESADPETVHDSQLGTQIRIPRESGE